MYQKVAGVATGTGGAIAATVLPNTGSGDSLIIMGASLFSGLVAWGVAYLHVNKLV